MDKLKNLLIALDMTEVDDHLIRYASFFSDLMKIEQIYFIHIAANLELSDELLQEFPTIKPIDENMEEQIRNTVDDYFNKSNQAKVHIEIKEGNPAKEILHWAKIKDIDLILMGSKAKEKGSGSLARKIVTISPASILFVPVSSPFDINNILVPVDFSENSESALQIASIIAEKTESVLIGQHCYKVPSGYHTSGKSFDEFAEMMKDNAKKKFERFTKNLTSTSITPIFTLDTINDPGKLIFELADKINADLVVIGSKGRTELASIILGSVAEKLIQYDKNIPLLVVKKKNEILGFFDALLEI